jgi:hypothetical protein
LGVIATGVAWRRGNKGRVVQGVGLTLAPIALYFSGLLRLLWDGVVAVGSWAAKVILSPAVWFGLSLLVVCLLLWVVGGFVARRFPAKPRTKEVGADAPAARSAVTAKGKAVAKPPLDDDMAEIEALLKSRGIE